MRNFVIIVIVLLLFSCGEPEEKILPQRIRLTESVYASATIQPDSLYQVYAAVSGILDRNLVDEGDLVLKGTPLLQIINNAPKLNTENARLSMQLAQENYNGSSAILKGLEDEIRAATPILSKRFDQLLPSETIMGTTDRLESGIRQP